jgi:hypothetical protein
MSFDDINIYFASAITKSGGASFKDFSVFMMVL